MSLRTFYIQLTVLSLFTAMLIFLFTQQAQYIHFGDISWISLLFFILLSIIVYHLGCKMVNNRNKNDFSRLVLGFTGFKMMFSVALVFIYHAVAEPTSRWFVIPFLIIYILYTIFETHFLMRLGRMAN